LKSSLSKVALVNRLFANKALNALKKIGSSLEFAVLGVVLGVGLGIKHLVFLVVTYLTSKRRTRVSGVHE
jgi:hypothetical protein